jgi:DHA1 family bicyclomycin/chloramphenicol resistance-like MFS transporter
VSNAAIAGLLSPLVSHSGLALALTAAGFTAVGYALWRWYVSHIARYPGPVAPSAES